MKIASRLVGRSFAGILVLAALVNCAAPTQAKFIKPDLLNLPVPKLIESLEKMIDKKPKDATLSFNLARVHAMAYALKTDTTEIWKNKEADGAWFGYTPKNVPFEVKKTDDPAKKQAAEVHLKKALEQ